MKILLTGGTGFIGSNLAPKLIEWGHEVRQLRRNESAEAAFSGGIDAVLHAASYFVAEHKSSDVDTLIESNLLFGTRLLEAMHNHNTKLLINFGTSWQHFESAEYNPVCLYAATKQAFEDIVKYYVEARDFKAIHLKLFDTYGAGDQRPKLIKTLMRIAQSGESLQMSPGEQLIDLVHISDVISAVELALSQLTREDFKGARAYAVSQGERVTLKNLVATLERICGKKINIAWGARPYRQREVFEPWKTGITIPGWQPKTSLETGLKELWANHV